MRGLFLAGKATTLGEGLPYNLIFICVDIVDCYHVRRLLLCFGEMHFSSSCICLHYFVVAFLDRIIYLAFSDLNKIAAHSPKWLHQLASIPSFIVHLSLQLLDRRMKVFAGMI